VPTRGVVTRLDESPNYTSHTHTHTALNKKWLTAINSRVSHRDSDKFVRGATAIDHLCTHNVIPMTRSLMTVRRGGSGDGSIVPHARNDNGCSLKGRVTSVVGFFVFLNFFLYTRRWKLITVRYDYSNNNYNNAMTIKQQNVPGNIWTLRVSQMPYCGACDIIRIINNII